MAYKKCPKCELNYIPENEDLCPECKQTIKDVHSSSVITRYYSRFERGRIYGTNSREVYLIGCDCFGWNRSQSNQFGRQGVPLYAADCDADHRDVWFICYPNYDNVTEFGSNPKHNNQIKDNEDTIVETVTPDLGRSNNADRITFVKSKRGYEFLGVYKLVANGTTRVFKCISEVYLIK